MLSHFENLYKESPNGKESRYVGVQIRQSGHIVSVCNRVRVPWGSKSDIAERGEITTFSVSSAGRMRRYLRECCAEYRTFITLTYPGGHGYASGQAKRDLSVFFKRLRRKYEHHLFSAFWFMEFQRRGAIHFHIFCTAEFISKTWLSNAWYEIVGSEDERHRLAGTNVQSIKSGRKGITSYATKYAAKQQQKEVPKEFGWVGRFWGVVGNRVQMSADTYTSFENAKLKAVQRQLIRLNEMISASISLGLLVKLEVKQGTHTLYYCRCAATEMNLRRQIQQIDITNGNYQPYGQRKNWELDEELPEVQETKGYYHWGETDGGSEWKLWATSER